MTKYSLRIQLLERLSPAVGQPGTLVGTHQTPGAVRLHPAHEQVRDPEAVEQVTRPVLLLARVLPHVQEVEHVRVPRLQVDGECTGPLEEHKASGGYIALCTKKIGDRRMARPITRADRGIVLMTSKAKFCLLSGVTWKCNTSSFIPVRPEHKQHTLQTYMLKNRVK